MLLWFSSLAVGRMQVVCEFLLFEKHSRRVPYHDRIVVEAVVKRLNQFALNMTAYSAAILTIGILLATSGFAQQPQIAVDPTPIDGQSYYLLNQLSGQQADLHNASTTANDFLLQNNRNLTSLTQRWAFTYLSSGNWKIQNIANSLCMDTQQTASSTVVVQQTCAPNTATQDWKFAYDSNGYYTVTNASTGLALDLATESSSAGEHLVQTTLGASPTQSQLWNFRPVFYRGNDNALLAKQEADRIAVPTPFQNDAGTVQDVLQILKKHGFNMIRLRPTPLVVPGTNTPLYTNYTLSNAASPVYASCSGNGCHAETDASDLALAKRARQMGMSIALTLFFDGGSSQAAPGEWANYTTSQVSSAIYTYVKAQIEEYRAAGVMPDIVTIGNEVDNFFLATGVAASASGSPSSSNTNFATYVQQGIQAVEDAASDPALGAPLPPPLSCIHVTPHWGNNGFFTMMNQQNIPYDMICQSYYPYYHGALNSSQVTSSCPNTNWETEETNLQNSVSFGKPILMLEIGENYEKGQNSPDCYYSLNRAGQRQFVLDVQAAIESLPGNLAAGMDWWDGTGTNVTSADGSFYANNYNAGESDALYAWDGSTLFDDADYGNWVSNFSDPVYNTVLPALSSVGGTLDPSLAYKFVNASNGQLLELPGSAGSTLDTAADSGVSCNNQQWQISSNNDGYFKIANAATANVLDNGGSNTSGATVTLQTANSTPTSEQEWDVVSAGDGTFTIVNKGNSMVLGADFSLHANGVIEQQSPKAANIDWITPANAAQQWKIVPTYGKCAQTQQTAATPFFSPVAGTYNATQQVTISDATGGAAIYYTADGKTIPSSSSTLYSGPIPVSSTETIQAIAVATGYNSSAVTSAVYTIAPSDFTLALSPASLAVVSGSSGTSTVSIAPQNGFNAAVSFTCTGLPAGASCVFSPITVTPTGGTTANATLTVSTAKSVSELHKGTLQLLPVSALCGLFCWFGWRRRSAFQTLILLGVSVLIVAQITGCGASESAPAQQPTTTVTILATSGSLQHSASLSLTVQ